MATLTTYCICGLTIAWTIEPTYCSPGCAKVARDMEERKREEQLYWSRKQFRGNQNALDTLWRNDRKSDWMPRWASRQAA